MGSSGGLKQDLDNYLSRSSTSGKSSGISLPTATLGKWFRKNEDEEVESFLGTSKVSSFFPTLVRLHCNKKRKCIDKKENVNLNFSLSPSFTFLLSFA